MKKKVLNPWVFPWWLFVATLVLLGLVYMLVSTSTETWAKKAPLQTVTVRKGDTSVEIMRSLLPEDRKETENLGFLLETVASRTGEDHGAIYADQELQMPIPYGEWLQRKIWPW